MKNPVLAFAGLAVTGALVLAGCSHAADDPSSDTNSASAQEAAGAAAAATTSVADQEVQYDDLDIKEMDMNVDVAAAVDVTLTDGASVGGAGVTVTTDDASDADIVTITAGGMYRLSGSLSAGSIVVDAPDEDVTVILDGVDVTAAGVGAFTVVDAKNVVIYLAEGSQNSLADASDGVVDETDEEAPNAAVFSTADLWIGGSGSLSVWGANDGITSKDSLVITGGDVSVTAGDDGVRGKDHLVIRDGSLTVDAGGDALKADNEGKDDDPDAVVGVIWIEGGTIDLKAGSDAADAARQVTVNGGDLTIAAGDDGLHSDGVMRIDGGTIDILKSVEGIEGAFMYLSGGDVVVVSSDDGINVSGGTSATTDDAAAADAGATGELPADGGPGGDFDGQMPGGGRMPSDGTRPERPEGAPGAGDAPQGGDPAMTNDAGAARGGMGGSTTATDDVSTLTVSTLSGGGMGGPGGDSSTNRHLEFSGGTYVITADGDGVDVNGNLTMSGGTLVVNGPEGNGNGAMDVDGSFTINGGTVAASGSSGMAVAPDEGGEQAALNLNFSAGVPVGTTITISDSAGADVASFTTSRVSQSLVISSNQIVAGADYVITVGGDATGDSIGGLVVDGTADGGDQIGTVTAQ